MSLVTLNTVRYFDEDDVYHYTVDNRPLQDLASNDILLQAGLDLLYASLSGGVSDQIFVNGTDFVAGTDTYITLTNPPPNANSMWVFFDGEYKNQNTYTVSGSTITFGSPIPANVNNIEVKWSNIGVGGSVSTIVQSVSDTNFSIPTANDYVLYYSGSLTATRTVTLAPNGSQGYKVRIVRAADLTQSYNINVNSSSGAQLKALVSAGTWADFIYTGMNWIQTGGGSL